MVKYENVKLSKPTDWRNIHINYAWNASIINIQVNKIIKEESKLYNQVLKRIINVILKFYIWIWWLFQGK